MKVAVLTLLFLLTGCFSGIRYDNIELKLVAEVRQIASTTNCMNLGNSPTELFHKALTFQYFSEYSSGGETHQLATELRSLTEEFLVRSSEMSQKYCMVKLGTIYRAATRISETMGNKVRL